METTARTETIEGLEESPGWEDSWRIHRDDPEDPAEAGRRLGRESRMVDVGDEYVATIAFPSRVPNHPLKHRYGMPDFLPDYKYRVQLDGSTLWIHAALEDPMTSQLCGRVEGFPQKFSVRFDMPDSPAGFEERYWNRSLTVVLRKAAAPADEKYEWRGHYITPDCVGCQICELKCPTNAITGVKKDRYVIEPEKCINCGVCGIYCPYDSIVDQWGDLVKRIKAKDIPKAVVIPDLCSGCEYCIDTCPFDCIHLIDAPDRLKNQGYPSDMSGKIAWVDERTCVSCGVCETFCIKEAIVIDRKFNWDPYIGFSYQEGRAIPPALAAGPGEEVNPRTPPHPVPHSDDAAAGPGRS
ncbi:MAG TPA: 4Fe-4S binding protein [Candidatus Saccharimonadales bacterium]|nr:4Fe-4S binding protein [Candidatus Saccharimonadales bacterium]